MKKLFIVLIVLLFASIANAWTINWDAATGAEGYRMNWVEVNTINSAMLDVGNVLTYDLEDPLLGLVKGTRYEFWIQGYAQGSFGGESDHVRWTYPLDPIVIETLGAPVNIIINP